MIVWFSEEVINYIDKLEAILHMQEEDITNKNSGVKKINIFELMLYVILFFDTIAPTLS